MSSVHDFRRAARRIESEGTKGDPIMSFSFNEWKIPSQNQSAVQAAKRLWGNSLLDKSTYSCPNAALGTIAPVDRIFPPVSQRFHGPQLNSMKDLAPVLREIEYSSKLHGFETRLTEFEILDDDWDSYGAYALVREAIEEARLIIGLIRNSMQLKSLSGLEFYPVPNRSGGVSIHFEFQSRDLRIKFYPFEHKNIVYRIDRSNPNHFNYFESEYNRVAILSHISWLALGHD